MTQIFARADSGFYCAEAVEAYEAAHCQFVISARKTSRLVEQLEHADWKPSPKTDADSECELRYQPEGWTHACRFVALRYEKPIEAAHENEIEQYQLFETRPYRYRVFVTNLKDPVHFVAWFYNQRAGAENLHGDCLNSSTLGFGERWPKVIQAGLLAVCADVQNSTSIQIIHQCQVAVAFSKCLLVDSDMLDRFCLPTLQSPLDGSFHNGVDLIPRQAQLPGNRRLTGHRQPVDREAFK